MWGTVRMWSTALAMIDPLLASTSTYLLKYRVLNKSRHVITQDCYFLLCAIDLSIRIMVEFSIAGRYPSSTMVPNSSPSKVAAMRENIMCSLGDAAGR